MNLSYRHPLTFVGVRQIFSNIFSFEINGTIIAKFHLDPSKEGGTEVDINSPVLITKMAAMRIYGKKL